MKQWEAALVVLSESGEKSLHFREITTRIIKAGYCTFKTDTPPQSIRVAMTVRCPHNNLFRLVADGEYEIGDIQKAATILQEMNINHANANIELKHHCFKIDQPNAKAMIEGFRDRDGKLVHQSIWLDVKSKQFPMLVTLNRSQTKFRSDLSDCGKNLYSDNYSIKNKFIVHLDSVYFVRNDMSLWKDVCSNGLFNIWKPEAPFSRFEDSESDGTKYRICLMRLYEIYEEFKPHEIVAATKRIDHLESPSRNVNIKRAISSDEEFRRTRKLLDDSVRPYLLKDPIKYPELEITEGNLFSKPDVVSDADTHPDHYVDQFSISHIKQQAERREISAHPFVRSPEVRRRVLVRAQGKCEWCEQPGFIMEGGRIFLETHHVIPLSEEGADTENNVVALCPNHHREAHHGLNSQKIREALLYRCAKRQGEPL